MALLERAAKRPEQTNDGEIPEEGSPERIRLAASALHRRERQAFGGMIQWEAAFFGWLAAIGGGVLGERFHRAVDRAGIEFGAPEQPKTEEEGGSELPEEPETVAEADEEER